jgi:integrase
MLGEAARKNIIKHNPCNDVKELKEEEFKREILTVDEVKKLFSLDWSRIWKNDNVNYKMNRLAACTGMRMGELRGLLGKYVFDDHIYVCGQYTRFGYTPYTKTKENRNIPITPLIRQELEELLQVNGDGYVFSDDGGISPLTVDRIRRRFENALKNIGIDNAERIRRNITFHAWRHFLNTLLLMSNVVVSKVQKVTGHKTQKMTENYTHFDAKQFSEVRDVQNSLLFIGEPERT